MAAITLTHQERPAWSSELPKQLSCERFAMVRRSIFDNPQYKALPSHKQDRIIAAIDSVPKNCPADKVGIKVLEKLGKESDVEIDICKEAFRGKSRYDFVLVNKFAAAGDQKLFREYLDVTFQGYIKDKKKLKAFVSSLLGQFFTEEKNWNGQLFSGAQQVIQQLPESVQETVTIMAVTIIKNRSTGECSKFLLEKRNAPSLDRKEILETKYSKCSDWDFHIQLPKQSIDFNNHTLNVPNYLQNRFSKTLIELMKKSPSKIEIFIGSEDDERDYHLITTYNYTGKLKNPTSFTFNFYQNTKGDNDDYKIVIGGITSSSRLKHLYYVLSAFGISTDDIKLRGTLAEHFENEVAKLEQFIDELENPPSILILGGSSSFSSILERKFQGNYSREKNSMEFGLEIGKISLNGNEPNVIAMMRMPNGDLAYHFTRKFMEKGVGTVLLLGAGGTFMKHRFVGDYQPIYHTYYDETVYHLPIDSIISLEESTDYLPCVIADTEYHHVTVDTPLEETREWLETYKTSWGTVDVETAHVFGAFIIEQERNPRAKIFPGLFISDNVVTEPLEAKIGAQAYSNLDRVLCSLVNQVVSSSNIPVIAS